MRERVGRTKEGVILYNTSMLSDEEKAEFIQGWKDAGGYMGDSDSPCPWCAPWLRANPFVEPPHYNAFVHEIGRFYWETCKSEIEALLAQGGVSNAAPCGT